MISYVPAAGDYLLVALENRVLFFRAPALTTTGSITEVWDALGADDPVQAVLTRLTGAGLESTPHFALAVWSPVEQSVQVLVRGDILVDVESARVSNRIDARGVSTWRETTIEAATGLVVTTPGSASAATSALPLRAGVVGAASATASFEASAPTPAPVVSVVPEVAPDAVVTSESDVVEQTSMRITVPPAAEQGSPEPDDDIEHLLDVTIVRSPDSSEPAPEPVAEPAPETAAESAAEPEGDHDGFTIMSADLAALRSAKGSARADGEAADDPPRVPDQGALYLESVSGAREPLSQPILIGRAPSVSKVSSGQVPRLVTIAGNQDISRSHAQIAIEGDTVVVTDLHSRNGTSVVFPGKSAQLLRQGEPTAILVGTVIDLGGGISFTLRQDA